MVAKPKASWCENLVGKAVGQYTLNAFVGSGKIGYVYRASRHDLPGAERAERAVKLVFDQLHRGWEVELQKVLRLELVDGVVHLHDLGPGRVTHDGEDHLCQFTVWDYIAPGEDLRRYLKRVGSISASFLLALVERVLHVLHACEAQGVRRHGDLHAGNILIGDPSTARLDDTLQPRAPIYVSDFGFGTTGGPRAPKDDYTGLAHIVNECLPYLDYGRATAGDRRILADLRNLFSKLLHEPSGCERRPPLDLLRALADIKRGTRATAGSPVRPEDVRGESAIAQEGPSVGNFQVTEMIGDRWEWWRRLFVPTVPARSRILALDIPTVVTGPRGCGKTMLFRRLSERLVVECGEIDEVESGNRFVAFYVNANDFADAFAHFPERPTATDESRLVCYANLCILADVLDVQAARARRVDEVATEELLRRLQQWLMPPAYAGLLEGENQLDRYRTILESVKWKFPHGDDVAIFPGYDQLSQQRWLPSFFQWARTVCPWFANRPVILFVDDFSTPRVTQAMQRVLNRLLLQRSPYFLAKLATEAASTFVPEDSSGKNLEDGDDYQLVDMGEESLFLPENERLAFLKEVFSRRLELDPRIPPESSSLRCLLGHSGLSKTEFARRLRISLARQQGTKGVAVEGRSQRRCRATVQNRAKATPSVTTPVTG